MVNIFGSNRTGLGAFRREPSCIAARGSQRAPVHRVRADALRSSWAVADVAQVVFEKKGSVEESRMNRMGDFFSIMMMTSVTHDDTAPGEEVIAGLRSALQDTLSTGPEDDLCVPATAAPQIFLALLPILILSATVS